MKPKWTKAEVEKLIEEKNENYFHYKEIKDKQKECLVSILSGKDVLAVMPTGMGKSLCFQLPALCFEGITIVVTPIIALMQNQVDRFANMNLEGVAASIESTKSKKERREIYADVIDGKDGKCKIIYVSPERLKSEEFIEFARRADIDFLAIDEAHCISLWGYDFRESYLIILRFLKYLKKRPVIGAFTATATPSVCEDIKKLLGMPKDYEPVILIKGRDNLKFSIKNCNSKSEKTAKLGKFLENQKKKNGGIIPQGIVFCSTVDDVEHVYLYLEKKGYKVSKYYAALEEDEKKAEQNKFMSRQTDIMIATKAFGMGVDKSDIRFVIHYNLPNDLESYYQEAGRGGRDGKKTDCCLLFFKDDIEICNSLINKEEGRDDYDPRVTEYRKELAEYRLNKMIEYCHLGQEAKTEKLQKFIIDYFENEQGVPKMSAKIEIDEEEEEEIIRRRAEKIDNIYVNITKVANEIRKGDYQMRVPKTIDIGTNRGKFKQHGLITYELFGEDDEKITYFDMMVADAVYTLEENRVPVIYAKNVYAILTGDENIMIQPEKKKEIEESIDKMRRVGIRIDRSRAMFMGFTYKGENEKVIQDKMLPLEKRDGNGYTYTRFSPLSRLATILNGEYAKIKLELFNVKIKKEDDEKKLSSTTENIKLIHFLLYRINRMGSRRRVRRRGMSRRIRYDKRRNEPGIKEILGMDELENKYSQKRKMDNIIGVEGKKYKKGKIEDILDYFISQEWISGYERVVKNNEIVGVDITF